MNPANCLYGNVKESTTRSACWEHFLRRPPRLSGQRGLPEGLCSGLRGKLQKLWVLPLLGVVLLAT